MTELRDAVESFHAPVGSIVVVRDETWLVNRAERATDGWFVEVQGLSELVRDTEAIFSTALDDIEVLDPAAAEVVADDSPGHRRARLWLESTLRRTAVPVDDPNLTVARQGLADPLDYQLKAVTQALSRDNLRPRILLADAVGLGKTLEIGMILSELVRRGRGERILVVTPRHVLEQMQFELWTRFALPFVRLDSVGIQRIRQKLPANRNPFSFFKRVIVSIDTLKSDAYLSRLEKQHWDAVVIDESHNVTNSSSQNNRLARILSTRSDALVLASATPHNGKAESFAELISMLEPSAVRPDGTLVEDEVRRLVIRRHRHSPDVAAVVGGKWPERHDPRNILVPASAAENALADELDTVWLHPESGRSPYSGANAKLFPWTLAKAFLSSPAAFEASVDQRFKRITGDTVEAGRERRALERLRELNRDCVESGSAKYAALVDHLGGIGVRPGASERVVVFAERVATLTWLREDLMSDLGFSPDEVVVLHGGLSDVDQQEVVESFKQESSPIRVLVTGDVASEGVNLHLQCHHLVHFDIPWSLIRIEQRNGRIDRYGQRHRPVITTLLLDPTSESFAGDVRILERLVQKEHEAHKALGDSASLMGKHDVAAEEEAIRQVLAGERDLDDTVRTPEQVAQGGDLDALMALFAVADAPIAHQAERASEAPSGSGLYPDRVAFLTDALDEALETPASPPPNGVGWRIHPGHAVAEFNPPPDLCQRLDVLPQSYLRERRVTESMKLATSADRGRRAIDDARGAGSTSLWPEAHFLAPLHPALDWAADRALGALGRNQIFAVEGPVEHMSVLTHAALMNARGQIVTSSFAVVSFPSPTNLTFSPVENFADASAALAALGITGSLVNRGRTPDVKALRRHVAPAVAAARASLDMTLDAVEAEVTARVERWAARTDTWDELALGLTQSAGLRDRRSRVEVERDVALSLRPDQRTVRPLLVVFPTADGRAV